ncbi:hypothetical protein [Gilvimarinus sp. 1_MG-2023]|uniref:hypothetical protein n=1 Tax=Gilvimarinus sp. 1_MG-2023 TaxID=3062638 RepID=UPI0026E13B35|nr:hypothetical protein [Gilvimarinus sp. 1_MG-2023]MDO6746153.1 hypothetical protein [Gilvimarinus sp. 1_MG-2023]
MKHRYSALLLSLIATFITSTNVSADVVEIPIGQQTEQAELKTPTTGQTKDTVEQAFGEPEYKSGPTGEPAIYRWEYSDFVVYFEDNWVIHSVVKFTPKLTSR